MILPSVVDAAEVEILIPGARGISMLRASIVCVFFVKIFCMSFHFCVYFGSSSMPSSMFPPMFPQMFMNQFNGPNGMMMPPPGSLLCVFLFCYTNIDLCLFFFHISVQQ